MTYVLVVVNFPSTGVEKSLGGIEAAGGNFSPADNGNAAHPLYGPERNVSVCSRVYSGETAQGRLRHTRSAGGVPSGATVLP